MPGTCSEDSEDEAEAEEMQPRIPVEGFRRERRNDTPEPEEHEQHEAPLTGDAKVQAIIASLHQRESQQSQEDIEDRHASIEQALKLGVDVLDLVCCASQDEVA